MTVMAEKKYGVSSESPPGLDLQPFAYPLLCVTSSTQSNTGWRRFLPLCKGTYIGGDGSSCLTIRDDRARVFRSFVITCLAGSFTFHLNCRHRPLHWNFGRLPNGSTTRVEPLGFDQSALDFIPCANDLGFLTIVMVNGNSSCVDKMETEIQDLVKAFRHYLPQLLPDGRGGVVVERRIYDNGGASGGMGGCWCMVGW
jgi:hypothetical protein